MLLSAKPKTAAMAWLSNGYTSTCVFVLLSLAVCVLLTTSVPTGQLSKIDAARMLHSGLTLSVSCASTLLKVAEICSSTRVLSVDSIGAIGAVML